MPQHQFPAHTPYPLIPLISPQLRILSDICSLTKPLQPSHWCPILHQFSPFLFSAKPFAIWAFTFLTFIDSYHHTRVSLTSNTLQSPRTPPPPFRRCSVFLFFYHSGRPWIFPHDIPPAMSLLKLLISLHTPRVSLHLLTPHTSTQLCIIHTLGYVRHAYPEHIYGSNIDPCGIPLVTIPK